MLAKIKTPQLSRRGFLTAAGGAGVGLVVGLSLPGFAPKAARAATDGSFNPFVLIAPDGTVTVLAKHLDKGQGILTGLTTLVAEELDADWAQMRGDHAPADTEKYKNLFFGVQGTGGSTAIANSWQQYRKAGAMARAMLVEAAAKQWGVAASKITVKKGVIAHASGNQAGFGDLAEAAAGIAAPADVALKDPSRFTLIGNPDLRRVDGVSKTDGSAIYTQDIVRPGMLYAAVAHPPRFGATVASFDAAAAKAVDGVEDVVQIPRGVAVLARDTWNAFKGRDALAVEWDESKAETRSTEAIFAEYRPLLDKAGTPARSDGDAEAALADAAQVVEADFEFPFLAHAAMEPMNAVVDAKPGTSVEIWTGSQLPTVDQNVAGQIAGVEPGQVTINVLLAGGSF
ncbi:MAG: molybdopterin-dependent oxidoreductase, partial [Minwuiales bacterium]|nr:molybdopterin-dependent oxidoreductase [Minwuiales bacterium]